MVYGNGVNATCYNDPYQCNSASIASTGWVFKSNVLEGQSSPYNTWFLSPDSSNANFAFLAGSSGSLSGNSVYYYTRGVRPVVYLKSDIKISEGTGEVGSPFKLQMMQ